MKRHAWKACNRQNRFAGSHPGLSASFISVQLSPCRRRAVFFVFCILVVPHLRRGLWIMPSSQLAVPHRRLRLPLSSLFLRKHHDFTISRFHDFTISRFHDFTASISRNDAIAVNLAPDGNNLTAVAVAARAAGLFSLLPWNLDNLASCALQPLTP